MMRFLRSRRRLPIGVEIRSNEVRMVRLTPMRGGNLRIDCADVERLSPVLSVQHAPMDWVGLRSLMIKMVKRHGFQGQPAVISLPATGVRMQRMVLPDKTQPYAIETAIHARIRQEMPGLTDAICVDYAMTPNVIRQQQDVFYVAARQVLLSRYVDCAVAAGLEVKIVDVDLYAMQRVLQYQREQVTQKLEHDLVQQSVDAFIFYWKAELIFTVFDNSTIIFYLMDMADDLQSVVTLTEKYIVTFRADYPDHKIQRIYLYAHHDDLNYLKQMLSSVVDELVVCEFSQMMQTTQGTERIVTEHRGDLLIACGLAMRELPIWC